MTSGTPGTSTGSTGQPPDLLPHEQAALLACEAHAALPESPTPFEMGNEFPQRFRLDSASRHIPWSYEDYVCYDIWPGDIPGGEVWWFSEGSWVEEDGQIHVYMATADIDAVVYYGSHESEPDVPGAPLTEAIEYDVSALCPELPRVWMPDPEGNPEEAGRICMQHATTIAEAVFVRVP